MNSLSLSNLPRLFKLVVKKEVNGTLGVNQSLLQADKLLQLLKGLLLLLLLALPRQLEPLELGLAVVVVVVVVDAHPLLGLLHLLQGILKHLKYTWSNNTHICGNGIFSRLY